ncbi:TetR/AcrR family transcriptional regulator [Microbacterium marinilacus]|uniref:TetR/AcrR family transcriptional regulator n=1 Tax=Microbacterium marinilacus TaxID=415209 RepID=A0ABP7BPD2_9MICO|nr:TetR/AcrR family transcriptional regulator [Microbacterium marinilacus]MBY0689883.1 TetR/AcrR family transcriptional regulator [Microbacterium marinilacus]
MPSPDRGGAGAAAGAAAAQGRRGPGRPRAEGHDERLIDAALALIDAGEHVTAGRLVERSGVSRAAIYRRWPSLADLVATALDRGREPLVIPTDGDLRVALFGAFVEGLERAVPGYPEARMRRRLVLGLEDRALQRAYWEAHVARRRVATVGALRVGMERGVLRGDLDPEACADLLSGVIYYQIVVRGEPLSQPSAVARCRAAFDVIWRGMEAAPT